MMQRDPLSEYIILCTKNKGECGYGPNIVKDGQIFNNIEGREAVLKVLAMEIGQEK
jgi:hypothetical protein